MTPKAHSEVYRYDAGAGSLACLSCNPTQAPAPGSDASCRSNPGYGTTPRRSTRSPSSPTCAPTAAAPSFRPRRPRPDRHRRAAATSMSGRPRTSAAAATEGGCVYLISSGKSARANYLFGVTKRRRRLHLHLRPPERRDPDETPSIYDARVNGGFARLPSPSECQGEACQPAADSPAATTPASAAFRGEGNRAGQGPSCGAPARKAKALSRRAHRLRAHARLLARKGHNARRAKRMRRKAAHLGHRAHGLSRRAGRCRRAAR